jgi:hypothetical protein
LTSWLIPPAGFFPPSLLLELLLSSFSCTTR